MTMEKENLDNGIKPDVTKSLFLAGCSKEQLKEIAIRAKTIAIAICGWEETHFDNVQIDIDGEICVAFSHYSRGDTDTHNVYLTAEDMQSNIEEVVIKREEKRKELARKAKEDKIANDKKIKDAQEKAEKTTYLKLKAKYENG